MCGRYTFFDTGRLYARFNVSHRLDKIKPSYNITPGATVPVVIRQSPNQAVLMKWGLIPSWAEDESIGYKLINARVETIQQKPSYRKPFKTGRCIIPANGFYEWRADNGKTPHYVTAQKPKLLGLAGIYDRWRKDEHDIISFAIITTDAYAKLKSVHPRMPVVLREENESTWMDPSIQDTEVLKKSLNPIPEDTIQIYEVSKRVNRPDQDDPSLIEPVQS